MINYSLTGILDVLDAFHINDVHVEDNQFGALSCLGGWWGLIWWIDIDVTTTDVDLESGALVSVGLVYF
jgi:hypothetical protein